MSTFWNLYKAEEKFKKKNVLSIATNIKKRDSDVAYLALQF